MMHLLNFIKNEQVRLLVSLFILFLIFIISVCSFALHNIVSHESNPFFYMNF